MTLDIAIPTYLPTGPATFMAQNQPEVPGVRYVLSWQKHDNQPVPDELTKRADVLVVRCEQPGLSANRNNAVRHCTADIVLMGDDDVAYEAAGLTAVIEAFANRPDMQVAFVRNVPHEKPYTMHEIQVGRRFPKGYYVGTPEIAVRREACHDFDLRFGPGAPVFTAGEDSKWAIDALNRGLNCRMLPITVGHHKAATLGNRPIKDMGILRAQGKLLQLDYKLSWPLRIVLKAYKLGRNKQIGFFTAIKYMFLGALTANK